MAATAPTTAPEKVDAPTVSQTAGEAPTESPAVPEQSAQATRDTSAAAEPHTGPHNLPDDDIVTHQAETTIEAGSERDDQSDAGYSSNRESAGSTSISSSVRDYNFENGRRYHKFHEGAYQFPNDESEQDREDMKHAMIVNLCGGRLFYAPIKNPQNIIDLGTGTGIWAIDMGDQLPSASILGIDLSPIQPMWVPPNVRFMVDDVESPWLYPMNHFDLVHARHSTQAFKDFPKLLKQAYDHIKPGGWIELQEMHHFAKCDDGTMREDYPVKKWLALLTEGLKNLGPDASAVLRHSANLRNAGFINVEEKVFKVPIGIWPKNHTLKLIGLYLRTVILEGLQAISFGPLIKGLSWTREEVEVLLVDVRKAIMDSSQHTYYTFHVFMGQKPPSVT